MKPFTSFTTISLLSGHSTRSAFVCSLPISVFRDKPRMVTARRSGRIAHEANEEESLRPRKIAKLGSDGSFNGGDFAKGIAGVARRKWSDAPLRDYFRVKSYL
jgi:hypothetical protein